ncbi:MAG: Oxygen-independent coproporphyrinogen-III oxidase-like protein [Nitrospira sp.]|nr:MAG: Oxygen-independent coproporphyrinogen-III oxidase-like protein [Nitrospira sp.]
MPPPRDIGLYIHVPLCRQRCHFCAFYLEIATPARIEVYLSALARELTLSHRQNLLDGRALQSIYFGGGTPTVIPALRLAALLDHIRQIYSVAPDVEITIEAHPSTVTHSDLTILANAGVTRISLGAESMAPQDFIPIGRPGTIAETEQAVVNARTAGFSNINLDLMYGLPGQSLASWTATVESLIELNPTHISCYALTIEDHTKLAQDIAKGLTPPPDESLQIEMEEAAERVLAAAGFTHYEISNYARPGYACRHNLLYWTGGDYLGLGPSAQSYVDGNRFGNIADLDAYASQLQINQFPITDRRLLTDEEQQRDALIFGLRLLKGVPHTLASEDAEQRDIFTQLTTRGLVVQEDGLIRLTPLGRRFADSVAAELF